MIVLSVAAIVQHQQQSPLALLPAVTSIFQRQIAIVCHSELSFAIAIVTIAIVSATVPPRPGSPFASLPPQALTRRRPDNPCRGHRRPSSPGETGDSQAPPDVRPDWSSRRLFVPAAAVLTFFKSGTHVPRTIRPTGTLEQV